MNIEEPMEKKEIGRNPFVYNAPVRGSDFFDRDETINRLLKETVTGKSQGSVWITGERKVGKTSLLSYLYWKYGHYNEKIRLYDTDEYFDAAFVFLNTQYNRTREDFYQNMLQSVKTYSDFKIEPQADAFTNFTNVIKSLMDVQKYYFFFLVDEFDALVESMAIKDQETANLLLSELNSFIEGTGKIRFSCIFAANQSYNELMKQCSIDIRGSGLAKEPLELPWFTKDQVKELAQQYLKNQSLQFTQEETDFCFKMTQGYPYFVQKLFSIMYDQKMKNLDPNTYLSIVKKEYGKAFEDTVKDWNVSNMPKRTMEKIESLARNTIKNLGDQVSLIGYLKSPGDEYEPETGYKKILKLLHKRGGMTLEEISAITLILPDKVLDFTKEMEGKGFIEKIFLDREGKEFLVSLTQEGISQEDTK